jgi:hypothetical protein
LIKKLLLGFGTLLLGAIGTLAQTPITYGQPFRQGDIPAGNCAVPYINGTVASVWQDDVKSHWSDGSLKFAIISYIDPSAASGTVDDVAYEASTACNSGGVSETVANMLSLYNFDAQILPVGTTSPVISARAMHLLAPGSRGHGCHSGEPHQSII